MKRFLSVMATAALTVSLTACNNETQTTPSGGVIQRPSQSASSNSEQQQESSASESISDSDSTTADSGENSPSDSSNEGSKILIAYFTVPETDGVDTVAGASRVVKNGEVLGNTQYIAGIIQDTLAAIFSRSRPCRNIPARTVRCLSSRTMKRARTQDRSCPRILKISTNTTWCLSAIPTGTPIFPCRFIRSLRNTISAARQ